MMTEYIVIVTTPVAGGERVCVSSHGPYADMALVQERIKQSDHSLTTVMKITRPDIVSDPSEIAIISVSV